MSVVIVGGGIGGLTAALSLHAAGVDEVCVLEAASEMRELGVGVNLPPHAVRELYELGLGAQLAKIGVRTELLSYYDRQGTLIWAEPRGLNAGYRWPQYSVHRGRLHSMLLNAVMERMGPSVVKMAQRATVVRQSADHVEVRATDVVKGVQSTFRADLLIGADGIRSAVRTSLLGQAVPLASNGWIMYRGATSWPTFLGGKTMAIAGDESLRFVVYPLGDGIVNWLMVRPSGAGRADQQELGNWNRPVDVHALAAELDLWQFSWLDIPSLVRGTAVAYEYPMADIEPLPRWTHGRATLLGDAAHAMYPFGSNGASQAILDARVLAHTLAHHSDPRLALQAYEIKRREWVSAVQLANRRQAGDVMARVSALARASAHSLARDELTAVEQEYKKLAGFDVETLNSRESWTVARDPGA